MTLATTIETGQVNRAAADVYEEFFVPALFQRWAAPVADALGAGGGQRVLDVACGTGVLTRELSARVGVQGAVTGLDINEGMLAVARRRTSSIDWRKGEAEDLPFPDASFDGVACQFGLMFFRDRKRALREMRRVLKPGGRLAVAVWGSLEETPGYAAAATLLHRLFGATVAESLRSPYVLGDPGVLRELFQDCALCELSLNTQDGTVQFPSLENWIQTDVRGWTLADILDDSHYEQLLCEAKTALRDFVQKDGRVVFAAPAHIVTARKPF